MNPFYERADNRISNDISNRVKNYEQDHPGEMIWSDHPKFAEFEEWAIKLEANRIKRILKRKTKLQELVPELGNKRLNRMVFITIRPVGVEFKVFKHLVEKFTGNENKFEAVEYAYEQKGEHYSKVGDGFHVHIIARMSPTTRKMEILSHAKTIFKPYCPQPDIKTIFNDEDLTNKRNYIRDAKSADDNKKLAHEFDAIWRSTEGLDDIYTRGEIESP